MQRRDFVAALASGALAAGVPHRVAAQTLTMHAASAHDDDDVVTRTLRRFGELVAERSAGAIELVLHADALLGLERQYVDSLATGRSIEFAIVSPAHLAAVAKSAAFLEAPLLFRDREHWRRTVGSEALKPIVDELERAELTVIGWTGGSARHLCARTPVERISQLKGLKLRVPRLAVWERAFAAAGAAPALLPWHAVYPALAGGAVHGTEGDASTIEQMRLYEVAPHVGLSQHAIALRALCASTRALRRLPAPLRTTIVEAGRDAAAWGRELEVAEDTARLAELERIALLEPVEFVEREALKKLVDPVLEAYARETGADTVLSRINAIR